MSAEPQDDQTVVHPRAGQPPQPMVMAASTGVPVKSEADIDNDDVFCRPVEFAYGLFNMSISGEFTATVTLQRAFDRSDTWHDVESYTEPTERIVENFEAGVRWRLGVKATEFTDGDVHVRLSQ